MSATVFKYKKGKDGQWYFKLVAANGETVAVSEGYTSKGMCLKGIDAVKLLAERAGVEEEE